MIDFNIASYADVTNINEEILKYSIGKVSFKNEVSSLLKKTFGFNNLLTSSCTDALEMTALLSNIKPGDEVILPSYTFVSTANAFYLRGAKLVFIDTETNFPNIDTNKIEELITKNTKAIVCVHYGGFSCNMGNLLDLKKKYNLILIEDAAHSFDNYYLDNDSNKIPLGSIGDYGTFSFHETKNISCGEGGLLVVNNDQFKRAEIVWEKGTNRSSFFRGEVDKYEWVDIGSSFLMSEITAYVLFQNLKNYKKVQEKRVELWHLYDELLQPLINEGYTENVEYPKYSTKNGHNFFIVLKSKEELERLKSYLYNKKISAVTHYRPLHNSKFFKQYYTGEELVNTIKFSERLLRLPLHYYLKKHDVSIICDLIANFLKDK